MFVGDEDIFVQFVWTVSRPPLWGSTTGKEKAALFEMSFWNCLPPVILLPSHLPSGASELICYQLHDLNQWHRRAAASRYPEPTWGVR